MMQSDQKSDESFYDQGHLKSSKDNINTVRRIEGIKRFCVKIYRDMSVKTVDHDQHRGSRPENSSSAHGMQDTGIH